MKTSPIRATRRELPGTPPHYTFTRAAASAALGLLTLFSGSARAVAPGPQETVSIGGTQVANVANFRDYTVTQGLTDTTVITGTVTDINFVDAINFTLPAGKVVTGGTMVVSNYVAANNTSPYDTWQTSPLILQVLSARNGSGPIASASVTANGSTPFTVPTPSTPRDFTLTIASPYVYTVEMIPPMPPNFIPMQVPGPSFYGSASYVITLTLGDAPNTVSTLASLASSNNTFTLDPAFSPSITSYSATLPNSATNFYLSGALTYEAARVSSVFNGGAPSSQIRSFNYWNFSPLNVGNNTLALTVTAQDGSTTVYNINVTRAAAAAPEIAVYDGLPSNGIELTTNTGTQNFSASQGGSSTREFNIKNTGSSPLNVTTVALGTEGNPGDFTLIFGESSLPSATISPNGADYFEVLFTPTAPGVRTAKVKISSNDADENPFIINLTGGPANNAPTGIALSAGRIDEGNAPGATVGLLTAIDADSGDTHTFTFDYSSEMSVDNGAFTIEGNALKLNATADFETQSVYYIQVQVDDGNGGTYSGPFTVEVTDMPESPSVVTLASGASVTGAGAGTTISNIRELPTPREYDALLTKIKLSSGVLLDAFLRDGAVILKAGDTLEGAGGAQVSKLYAMSDGVFLAELKIGTGSPATTATTNKVVCRETNDDTFEIVARSGSAAPGTNSTFKGFYAATGGFMNRVYLKANTNESTASDTGLWAVPFEGTLTLLVKEGQTINIGTGPKRVNAISAFPVGLKSQAEGRVHYGNQAIITRLTVGADHAIAEIPSHATSTDDWTILARTGGDAPDGVGKYATLGVPAAEGGHVVFKASLAPSATVTSANNVIVVGAGETYYSVLARKGDIAPGTSNTFASFEDPAAGTFEDASFVAKLSGATSATDEGLWWVSVGTAVLVTREGAPAPGIGGGVTIKSITRFAHPEGDQGPIFMATLNGATTKTNSVLYGSLYGEAIVLARTGDQFNIDGTLRTLTAIKALKQDLGSEGVARGYNYTGVSAIGSFGSTRNALLTLPVEYPLEP